MPNHSDVIVNPLSILPPVQRKVNSQGLEKEKNYILTLNGLAGTFSPKNENTPKFENLYKSPNVYPNTTFQSPFKD